jgi:hypothetical protein
MRFEHELINNLIILFFFKLKCMTEQSKERKLSNILRLLFPVFYILLCLLALLPIYLDYPEFGFFRSNLLFMILFGISLYWLFFHRLSFVLHNQWIKILIILILPLVLFNVYNQITSFNIYVDRNQFLDDLFKLPYTRQQWLAKYIRREYLFIGVGAFVTGFILFFHLIRLVWKQINNR